MTEETLRFRNIVPNNRIFHKCRVNDSGELCIRKQIATMRTFIFKSLLLSSLLFADNWAVYSTIKLDAALGGGDNIVTTPFFVTQTFTREDGNGGSPPWSLPPAPPAPGLNRARI